MYNHINIMLVALIHYNNGQSRSQVYLLSSCQGFHLSTLARVNCSGGLLHVVDRLSLSLYLVE